MLTWTEYWTRCGLCSCCARTRTAGAVAALPWLLLWTCGSYSIYTAVPAGLVSVCACVYANAQVRKAQELVCAGSGLCAIPASEPAPGGDNVRRSA